MFFSREERSGEMSLEKGVDYRRTRTGSICMQRGGGGLNLTSRRGVWLSKELLSDTGETRTPQDVCERRDKPCFEDAVGRQTCGRWQQEGELAGGD